MANTLTKPNDILVATLKDPNISTVDLLRNNINADNTSFLSLEEYKNTPLVQKAFTNDKGVFNESEFEAAYTLAAFKYQDLSNSDAFKNWDKELEYSATSIYRPQDSKVRDNSYKLTRLSNPLGESYGVEGINKKGAPKYTEEEAAQRNKIYDPRTDTWLNETPESLSLLDKVFGKTLIYAKYDQDTIDQITGEVHYKGERKKDDFGNYYTQILDDEELLDKEVVHLSDILTKEDSWLNKVDFFDSDGYDKSVAGIAAKTTFSLLPWLIPGFNTYYGAVTAILGLCAVMPTFYKSFEHLITGDEDTASSRAATQLENWFRKFEKSKSRTGQQSLWNMESIATFTTEIFAQLYQQRAAASLAKYFTSDVAKSTRLGQGLALGYMGLISANDVYNEALRGGYDKRTAGIASLATASALFGIMNFNSTTRGIGTWFLDKTTGSSQEIARAPIIKVAKDLLPQWKEGVEAFAKGDKYKLANTIYKFKSGVQDILILPTESMWKSAIVESAEEVSEEVIQDMVKGITDTMSWLGWTGAQGSFGGWENVFSQQGLERYVATFLGGAAGGALFHLNMDHIEPWINNIRNGNSQQTRKRELDIYDVILAGKTDMLIQELKNLRPIFNTKLAPTNITLSDGTKVAQIGIDGESQADFIINAAIKEVQLLEQSIKPIIPIGLLEHQFGIQDGTFSQLKNAKIDQLIISDYKEKCKKAAELIRDLNSLNSEENKDRERKQELQDQLDNIIKEINGYGSGESDLRYGLQFGALLNEDIRRAFSDLDENTWLQDIKGINPDEITDQQLKEKLHKEYELWIQDLSGEDALKHSQRVIDILLPLLQTHSGDLRAFINHQHKSAFLRKKFSELIDDEYMQGVREQIQQEVEADTNIRPEDKQLVVDERYSQELMDFLISTKPNSFIELIKSDPRAFSLSDYDNYDLAQELISKGIITLRDDVQANSDAVEVIKRLINTTAIASRMNRWNKDALKRLITQEVNFKLAEQNYYSKRLQELLSKGKEGNSEAIFDLKTSNFIRFNDSVEITEDIEYIKIKSIEEYIANSGLDEDNQKILLDAYISQLRNAIDRYNSVVEEADRVEVSDLQRTEKYESVFRNIANMHIDEYSLPEMINTRDAAANIVKIIDKYNALKTQQTETNPLVNVLKNVHFTIFGNNSGNIFDILDKEELKLQDALQVGKYTINSDLRSTLENIVRTINVVQAMVSSTIARQDGGGVTQIARDYAKDYLNSSTADDDFLVTAGNDAEYIYDFLQQLRQKVSDLLLISEQVTRNIKLAEKIKRDKYLTSMAKFYQTVDLKITINGQEFDLLPDKAQNGLNDNQYIDKVETIISQQLQNLKLQGISESDIIDALVNKFKDNIHDIDYTVETAIQQLSEDGDLQYKNNFIVHHLLSLSHYAPKQFKQDLNTIYDNNPNSLPSVSQQMAMRSILTYINNPDFEQTVIEKIGVSDNPEDILKTLVPNTITVLGGGGTGKTFMLGLLKQKLTETKKQIIVTAETQEKVDDLKKKMSINGQKTTGYLLRDLFGDAILEKSEKFVDIVNTILTNYNKKQAQESGVTVEGNTIHVNKDGIVMDLVIENDTLHNITIDDSTFQNLNFNKDGIIIIDEATFLNPFLSQLLNYNARKNSSFNIQVGDVAQMGFSFTYTNSQDKQIDVIYNMEHLAGFNTGILEGDMRFFNTGKQKNLSIFRNLLTSEPIAQNGPITSLYKESQFDINESTEKLRDYLRNHKLIYRESSDLMGDFVTSDEAIFATWLQKIMSKEGTKLFVVDSEEGAAKLKALDNRITDDQIVTSKHIQGNEADYVVVYDIKSRGSANTDTDAQKASMLVGRSRKFGLYFDASDGVFHNIYDTNEISEEDEGIQIIDNPESFSDSNQDFRSELKNDITQIETVVIVEEKEKPISTIQEGHDPSGDDNAIPLDQDIDGNDDGQDGTPIEQLTPEQERRAKAFDETDNPSILHSVFTRLGITRDEANLLAEARTIVDAKAILDRNPNSEISWFYNLCKDHRNQANRLFGEEFVTKVNGRLTGLQLLQYFEEAGRRVLYNPNLQFAVIGTTYNSNIDWAYNKVNDRDKFNDGSIYLRVAVIFPDSTQYISIGRLGYNFEEGDPRYSKIQQTLYENTRTAIESGQVEYIKPFKYRESDIAKEAIQKYLEERNADVTGFLIQYTNLREYITQEIVNGAKIDVYGRLPIEELEKLGFILKDIKTFDPSDRNSEEDFLRFYNSFRIDPLTQDSEKWQTISPLKGRYWGIFELTGTNLQIPVVLNVKGNYNPKTYSDSKNLTSWSLKQMLQGLQKIANISDELKGIRFSDLYKSDKEQLLKLLEKLKAFSGFSTIQRQEIDNLIASVEKSQINNTKTIAVDQNKVSSLITLLQTTPELSGFFYDDPATIDDIKDIYIKDKSNIVVSRYFEAPRYLIVWGNTTISDEQSLIVENQETTLVKQIGQNTTNPNEFDQAIESYKDLLLDRSVPLEDKAKIIKQLSDILSKTDGTFTPDQKERYLNILEPVIRLKQTQQLRTAIEQKCI